MERSTPHRFAAAEISISRAVAPVFRSGSKNWRTLREPPVLICPNFLSASAWTTRTLFQSASSSSATSTAIPVYVPWPISDFARNTVTAPPGSTRRYASGASAAPSAASARAGRWSASHRPAPDIADSSRNSRRPTLRISLMSDLRSRS